MLLPGFCQSMPYAISDAPKTLGSDLPRRTNQSTSATMRVKTTTTVRALLKSTDVLRNLEASLYFYSGSWALKSVNLVKNAMYARAANVREQTGREGPLVLAVLGSGKLG